MILATVALFLGGCTSGDDEAAPTPTPTPTPTATPSPTPELIPVEGKRVLESQSVSSDRVLGLGRSAAKPNRKAVRRALGQVGNWLDRHLDNLQRGGKGRWDQVAPKGLANAKKRRPVTTGLASAERPVESARYVLTAFHDGAPEMVTADVVVQHPEGKPSQVFLVFSINKKGNPVLTMFGPPPEKKKGSS